VLKYLIILIFIITSFQSFAQDYTITTDEDNGESLILGYCPVTLLNDSLFDGSWTSEYNSYNLDYGVLDSLEGKLNCINITIVFRSTCSDSREQLPRFFKILKELNYNVNSITLIGVDREKQGLSDEVEGFRIEFVPTIIFYKDGNEIGRIVETPAESLEKDLLRIIS